MKLKCCNKCDSIKELDDFPKHPHGRLGVTNICKSCTNLSKRLHKRKPNVIRRTKEYNARNKEKRRLYYRIWNHTLNGKRSRKFTNRKSKLKRTHKITPEKFIEMRKDQNNSCAICCRIFPTNTRYIHIDHSHKTGKIRSLLCSYCNPGLGHFREDTNLLMKAIKYLELHKNHE